MNGKSKRKWLWAGIVAVLLLAAGCQGNKASETVANLVSHLQGQNYGVTVETVEKADPFRTADRQLLTLDEEEIVTVYVYDSAEAAAADGALLSEDGCGYRNGDQFMQISWVAPPYFYLQEDCIIQYVGEDTALLAVLNDYLGEPFAGAAW